jgi:hypothetical protein
MHRDASPRPVSARHTPLDTTLPFTHPDLFVPTQTVSRRIVVSLTTVAVIVEYSYFHAKLVQLLKVILLRTINPGEWLLSLYGGGLTSVTVITMVLFYILHFMSNGCTVHAWPLPTSGSVSRRLYPIPIFSGLELPFSSRNFHHRTTFPFLAFQLTFFLLKYSYTVSSQLLLLTFFLHILPIVILLS